ncbi:MAG: efflux RND transporter periplasmic adaptor subunit [Anaerolineae bacterium]|nr:efflux RND transporter periplasmic adaptor subunit [Anaerolineae bacterium]
MKISRNITLMVFLIVIATTGTGCVGNGNQEEPIHASGTIEAVEVVISTAKGGRIAEVWVTEGQWIEKDTPVFRLEDNLLESQYQQVESALAVAQANYNLVAAGLTNEQKLAAVSAAKLEFIVAEQALSALYDNADIELAKTNQVIAASEKAIDAAQRRLNNYAKTAPQADIDQAFANMVLARDKYDDAQEDFEEHENKPEDNLVRAVALSKMAQAKKDYDATVRLYNSLIGYGAELDIAEANAELALAQAQLAAAHQDNDKLINGQGPDPDKVALTEAQVEFASAGLALAKAESPTSEQLAVAQAQVDAAKANLQAVQVLIDQLIIFTPISGVVMTRNIETGELIQPGIAAMTISQLDTMTVTVYVSESQYGKISLGDNAQLKVDSFPLRTFNASVTRIANQAEYTPRNVQTQEERQNTVYAIKLSLQDPDGILKPGMPSDVVFDF